jgi:hypothetical protein
LVIYQESLHDAQSTKYKMKNKEKSSYEKGPDMSGL